jgi:hypothetical protein
MIVEKSRSRSIPVARLQEYRLDPLVVADPVYVFCSSGGGNDPLARGGPAQAGDCKSYQPIGDGVWSAIPAGIRVPHTIPMGKGRASAFVVRRIEYPLVRFDPPAVEWFSREGALQRKRGQDLSIHGKRRESRGPKGPVPFFVAKPREGEWRQGYETKRGWRPGIPTRGEYLIRNGGNTTMRPFSPCWNCNRLFWRRSVRTTIRREGAPELFLA